MQNFIPKNVAVRWLRCCFVLLCCAATSQAQVFNGGFINILDNSPANPYPSTINVAGLRSPITSPIRVTISGFSHTFPADLAIRLQSPSGASIYLMLYNGGSLDAVNATLTFDDNGIALPLGPGLVSTAYQANGGSLGIFNGSNPNGNWSLFVNDDAGADIGQILSWSIDFSASDLATPGISAFPIGPSTCFASDGRIQITGLKPNQFYRMSYERNGAFFTAQNTTNERGHLFIENLVAGTYRRIIVDVGQGISTTTAAVELVSRGAPSFTIRTSNPTTCRGEGTAVLSGLQPNTTYRIMLSRNSTAMAAQNISSNGAGELTINNLQGGELSLVVSLNGCNSATEDFKLTVPPSPTLTYNATNHMSVCGQNGSIDFNTTTLANGSYLMSYSLDGYEQNSVPVTVVNNMVSMTNLTNLGYYSRFKITGGACSATALVAVPIAITQQPSLAAVRLVTNSCAITNSGVITFSTSNLPNGNILVNYTGPGSPKSGTVLNNVLTLSGLEPGNYSGFSVSLNNCIAYDGSLKTITDGGSCSVLPPPGPPAGPPPPPPFVSRLGAKGDNSNMAEAMPNPATNVVYVKLNDLKGQNVSLGLISMLGQRVTIQKVTPTSNTEITDIDLRLVRSGMYLIEVVAEERKQILKVLKVD